MFVKLFLLLIMQDDNDSIYKEAVFCRAFHETALGQILLKYADVDMKPLLDAYLSDYVHMMYRPACSSDDDQKKEFQVSYISST